MDGKVLRWFGLAQDQFRAPPPDRRGFGDQPR
jgi:hypothetical protein